MMAKILLTSAATAVQQLRNGLPLNGIEVEERIGIGECHAPPWNPTEEPVHVTNCKLKHFEAMGTFNSHVDFLESTFGQMDLLSCFFLQGITISGCRFLGDFNFRYGGHNRNGAVLIESSVFEGFANFEDCWFPGPVKIKNVQFQKGSNLLGLKGQPNRVTFETPLEIADAEGKLDIDWPT